MEIITLPDRLLFRRGTRSLGVLSGTTFSKTVNTKNIYRATKAWGLDAEMLSWMSKEYDEDIDIILVDQKKKKYTIKLSEALKVGEHFQFGNHGLQLFVPLKEFKI